MAFNNLPNPLNTFTVENPSGSYKDFGLSSPEDYPIPGVYYYADYGFIPGYTGEDSHDLDLFVGSNNAGKNGYFTVWRSEDVPEEHKFFVSMADEELEATLQEYAPVLRRQQLLSMDELLASLEAFRDKS